MSWRAYEILDGKKYCLYLCQRKNQTRYFKLAEIGTKLNENTNEDVVFVTEIVPNDLLRANDIETISKTVLLADGRQFIVDAHRMWLSESENRQFFLERVPFDKIQWETDQPPKFASR